MTQIINRRISLSIVIITTLHVIALAAYVYDLIPDDIQKFYFWAKTDIYLLLLIGIFSYIIVDKVAKVTLFTSFLIHLYYVIIVNLRYFLELSSQQNETKWLIHFCVCFLLILINVVYYVRSSK